jgi:hypothetical protein
MFSFFCRQPPGTRVPNRALNLILAALFELRLAYLENRQLWDEIGRIAEALGGDRSAMYFGAPPPERLAQGPCN